MTMANARLNNYKLSCVGVDDNGNRARCMFLVYDVKNVDEARAEVRSSNQRRKIMRRQKIDWRTVTLRAVRCNKSGGVGNGDRLMEEQIARQERQEQDVLLNQWRIKNHWTNQEVTA